VPLKEDGLLPFVKGQDASIRVLWVPVTDHEEEILLAAVKPSVSAFSLFHGLVSFLGH